jgi:hypothetical protein
MSLLSFVMKYAGVSSDRTKSAGGGFDDSIQQHQNPPFPTRCTMSLKLHVASSRMARSFVGKSVAVGALSGNFEKPHSRFRCGMNAWNFSPLKLS